MTLSPGLKSFPHLYLVSFFHLSNNLLLHSCFPQIMPYMVPLASHFLSSSEILQMTFRSTLWKNDSYQTVPPTLFKSPVTLRKSSLNLLPCNGHTWQIYFLRWLNVDPPLEGSVEKGMVWKSGSTESKSRHFHLLAGWPQANYFTSKPILNGHRQPCCHMGFFYSPFLLSLFFISLHPYFNLLPNFIPSSLA